MIEASEGENVGRLIDIYLKEREKTTDRLLDQWIHQNKLLWIRSQTLTALQLPVLGGWYYFYFKPEPEFDFATYLAALGVVLSALIWNLFHCDADRRDYLRDKVKEMDPYGGSIIFPKTCPWLRGRTVMQLIVGLFFVIDLVLAALAGAKLICLVLLL